MDLKSVEYAVNGRIATITLNRPSRLNAIDTNMPKEIRKCVEAAEADPAVHVIVLQGKGTSFCAGYDLKAAAESKGKGAGTQEMPWDPMVDFKMMGQGNSADFMTLFKCNKPTIAKVHGYCVAGGSDIALCCDIVIMGESAKIGYPPARIWGVPSTGMWVFRIGPQAAKRMLFTGDLVDAKEAKELGICLRCVPDDQLDAEVMKLAKRMEGVPRNQLMMVKLMINSALENQGLATTQMLASLFDGIARHTPEGVYFKEKSEKEGFHAAVKERDSGDWIAKGVSKM